MKHELYKVYSKTLKQSAWLVEIFDKSGRLIDSEEFLTKQEAENYILNDSLTLH